MDVHQRGCAEIGVDRQLRPALDEARHRLAALPAEQRRAVGIGLVQIERDVEGIADDGSPSRITGTVFETPPSTAGTAVKGVGTLRKSSPLWASAIAVFQQCGLKGRCDLSPTRS